MISDLYISKNAEMTRPNLCSYGAPVAIDSGFYCTTAMNIGDYVHIGPNVTIIGGGKVYLWQKVLITLWLVQG